MKVLLLLRHADSADKVQGQTDYERALTGKGVQQLSAVTAFMKSKSLMPEKVIASTAVRVRTTVELLLKDANSAIDVDFIHELYEADIHTYTKLVHRTATKAQSLLIVGHNPAISAFASHISRTRVGGIGTANLLVFQFKGSTWDKLGKGECELMEHFAP